MIEFMSGDSKQMTGSHTILTLTQLNRSLVTKKKRGSQPAVRKLDIVYLWVDCVDAAWRDRHNRYASTPIDPLRHCDMGEIYVSLRTLEKYIPRDWVIRLFVVTDDQRLAPGRLSAWALSRITYVDHKTIMPALLLPVFNSMVIEAHLHRIPGLRDDFLYLNDDVMLANHIGSQDLWHHSGVPIVYYVREAKHPSLSRKRPWLPWRLNAINMLEAASKRPLHVDIRTAHSTVMLSKRAYDKTWQIFGPQLHVAMRTRFREDTSVNFWYLTTLVASTMGWCALLPTSPEISQVVYCETERPAGINKELAMVRRVRPKFLCVNNLHAPCAAAWSRFVTSFLLR